MSMLKSNFDVMYDRLCLKNVPIDLNRELIREKFFPSMENIDIHFPKKINGDTRLVYVQFRTKNEAKMAMTIINMLEYKRITACYAKRSFPEITNSPSSLNCPIKSESSENELISESESNFMLEMRRCSFCGLKESKKLCSGCATKYYATFYCSEDHQEKDWLRHKPDCKTLPSLKLVSEHFTDGVSLKPDSATTTGMESSECDENETKRSRGRFVAPQIEAPKVGDKVLILQAIENNRMLFIRPVNSTEKYEKLMKDIKNYERNASNLCQKPLVGDYVLAPLNRNEYGRARVQDVFEENSNGCNIKVLFIEYGKEENLRWQDTRALNYSCRGFPTHIFKVILEDVKNYVNPQVFDYLKNIQKMGEELEVVSIHQNKFGDRKVILKHVKTNVIVNEYINELLCKSTSMKPDSSNEPIFYNNDLVPKLKRADNVKIRIIDSSRLESEFLLACMPDEIFKDYVSMLANLQAFAKKVSNHVEVYEPQSKEICLVKYENNWCRAIKDDKRSAEKDSIFVILIDTIKNAQVSKHNIKKIPNHFAANLFSSLCAFEGVKKMSKQQLEQFYNGQFVYVDVKYDTETKCYVLSLPQLSPIISY